MPNADEVTLSDLEKATSKMGQAIMQHTLQIWANEKQPPPPEPMTCGGPPASSRAAIQAGHDEPARDHP